MDAPADSAQARFAQRWGHLRRARVRALAWLLDAPGLLDPGDPRWAGSLVPEGALAPDVADWLAALDRDPAPLDAALAPHPPLRLGLYAEQLMALYFSRFAQLVAHGLQVRAARNDTVGEFDFLLDEGDAGLGHIELATKFYLFDPQAGDGIDALVGPNRADTLGRKMHKIVAQQLHLGQHPAAQAVLPRPVGWARALVKGWLFYRLGSRPALAGIAPGHCHGFWCTQDEFDAVAGDAFLILPKLQWLAPFQAASAEWMLDRAALRAELASRFAVSRTPVLVAVAHAAPGQIVEVARGFVVPHGWQGQGA